MRRSILRRAAAALTIVGLLFSAPLSAQIDNTARGLALKAQAAENSTTGLRERHGPVYALMVGDSLTNGNNDKSANAYGALSYSVQLAWRSKGRIVIRKEIGIPGNTSTQIINRSFDEGFSSGPFDVMFLLEGTNDLIANLPTATTLRNDTLLIRTARAKGMLAVVIAMPPNDLNGAGANALNALKRTNAISQGAIWIDPWGAARASNGTYAVGASTDGVHPVQAQTALAAQVILTDPQVVAFLPTYGAASPLSSTDIGNPIPQSAFDGTYPTGGNTVPVGWNAYGTSTTGTWSVTVTNDPITNIALTNITASAGATGTYTVQSQNFDITSYAGSRVAFSGRLVTSNMALCGGNATVRIASGGDTVEGTTFQLQPLTNLITDGDGYFYAEASVPASSTNTSVIASLGGVTAGGCTMSFGELSIRPVGAQLDIRSKRIPGRVRSLTASATLTLDDSYVLCDATLGPVTVTLPNPGVNLYGHGPQQTSYYYRVPGSGLEYTIIKIDASVNACTVATPASVSIEGSTTLALASQWNRARVIAAKAGLFVRGD